MTTGFLPAWSLSLKLPPLVLGRSKSGALSPTSSAAAVAGRPASATARTVAATNPRLFMRPPKEREHEVNSGCGTEIPVVRAYYPRPGTRGSVPSRVTAPIQARIDHRLSPVPVFIELEADRLEPFADLLHRLG